MRKLCLLNSAMPWKPVNVPLEIFKCSTRRGGIHFLFSLPQTENVQFQKAQWSAEVMPHGLSEQQKREGEWMQGRPWTSGSSSNHWHWVLIVTLEYSHQLRQKMPQATFPRFMEIIVVGRILKWSKGAMFPNWA